MRLIDADALYEQLKQDEELARNRVLDTESTLPYPNNLNPSYIRYVAQMNERTRLKHMIADAQTIEAQPDIIHCSDCKYWHREIYNGIEYFNLSSCDLSHHGDGYNFYCAYAKRREE